MREVTGSIYVKPVRVKRSDLDALVQACWSEWANGSNGLGEPVFNALARAVELAGGEISEGE